MNATNVLRSFGRLASPRGEVTLVESDRASPDPAGRAPRRPSLPLAAIILTLAVAAVADLVVLRDASDPTGLTGILLIVGSAMAMLGVVTVLTSALLAEVTPWSQHLSSELARRAALPTCMWFLLAVGTSFVGIALSTRDLAVEAAAHAPIAPPPALPPAPVVPPAVPPAPVVPPAVPPPPVEPPAIPPTAIAPPAVAPGPSPSRCPQVILYFSRGSGQSAGNLNDQLGFGDPGKQVYEALVRRYGGGEVGSVANGYPAISVPRAIRDGLGRYIGSVEDGVRSALRNITDLARLCPQSQLVLGGFSQGAQVTRTALAQLGQGPRARIAAVTLFGDPHFAATTANVRAQPSQTASTTYDKQQRGIGYRLTIGGAAAVPDGYAGRVFSWCHRFDAVCQGLHGTKNGKKAHGTYLLETEAVADLVTARLRARGVSAVPTLRGAAVHRVVGTCSPGPCSLATWSGPGTTSFKRVDVVYERQEVDISCQAIGEKVTGANDRSSAIWDKLTDGSFVADFYVDTPNVGHLSRPIPECSGLDAGP